MEMTKECRELLLMQWLLETIYMRAQGKETSEHGVMGKGRGGGGGGRKMKRGEGDDGEGVVWRSSEG